MLRGLLDTGATHTFVPLDVLEGLELKAIDIGRVEDFSGDLHEVEIYLARLTIPERFSADIRVYATASEALVGRDVLDLLRVTFDGPARSIVIES
jgi:predicted aspartyl protease